VKETVKHPLAVLAASLTLASINEILGITASLVVILYTLWEWKRKSKADHSAPSDKTR
jgi:hypothetical protein